MNDVVYAVKPLEWVKNNRSPEEGEWWSASTVFNDFHVEYDPEGCRTYLFRYCIDEYYDEGVVECESIADAKQKAEAYYLSRLLPALEAKS